MIKALKLFCLIVFVLIFIFSLSGCDELDETPGEDEDIIYDDPDNPFDPDDPSDLDDPSDPSDPPDIDVNLTLEEIIAAMLSEQEGTKDTPAVLKLDVEIGNMTDTNNNWHRILKSIETGGKYVDLDLSACAMLYYFFDPDYRITGGKNLIIKITLPDAATEIIGVEINVANEQRAFIRFTNLEFVSGKNIIHIGSYAFRNLIRLKEVDFQNLINIDSTVFANCTSLTKIDFPLLDSTGEYSFSGCSNLKTANLPELTKVKPYTFYECSNLETAYIPKTTLIDQYAFYNCSSLTEANFPLVEILGNEAFRNCESLTEAIFPSVKTINQRTFMGCKKLVYASFLLAEKIGNEAFKNCVNLQTAEFHADPIRTTTGHPLQPWINANMDYDPINFNHLDRNTWSWKEERQPVPSPVTLDSFIIHSDAFNGCKGLAILGIRNAWNVYFAASSLANIGSKLNLHLYDDNGDNSYGHPQLEPFLGNPLDPSFTEIKIYTNSIHQGQSQLEKQSATPGYPGLAPDIKSRYENKVSVEIERLP